jgi:hypothetical protein
MDAHRPTNGFFALCLRNALGTSTDQVPMFRMSNDLIRLCGSYEAMEGGFTTDALIDMTGGIEEAFELNISSAATQEFREQIRRVLWQAFLRKSMLGCSITVRWRNPLIRNDFLCRQILTLPKLDSPMV